jgi:hypothetical protein
VWQCPPQSAAYSKDAGFYMQPFAHKHSQPWRLLQRQPPGSSTLLGSDPATKLITLPAGLLGTSNTNPITLHVLQIQCVDLILCVLPTEPAARTCAAATNKAGVPI